MDKSQLLETSSNQSTTNDQQQQNHAEAIASSSCSSPTTPKMTVSDLKLSATLLEDFTELPANEIEKKCSICIENYKLPKILSCLHVFCEKCLDSLSNSSSDIICPTCKQLTKVGLEGVSSLTNYYIHSNVLDLSSIDFETLVCTSCKSKETAISRCNDCANLLCAGCDNAHKHMRCFENHEVVKLDELKNSDSKSLLLNHKPLFCKVHSIENLKYYCFNCQIPVCNECVIADHKGSEHHYDIISRAEKIVRGDIDNLIKEANSKLNYCHNASTNLTTSLTELQSQHDIARNVIDESYQNFKDILKKCRDESLRNLQKLHSERELKVMDLLQNIENISEKINGVCKFTSLVLDQANAVEFLSLKKLINNQFIYLIDHTPKCDINFSLEFDTKVDKFEQLAYDTFGKFRTESTPPSPKESTPPPTLPGMPPALMKSNNTNSSEVSTVTSSLTASSPISMPTSMQSSFDGDLSCLSNGFILPNVLVPDNNLTNNTTNNQNSSSIGRGMSPTNNLRQPSLPQPPLPSQVNQSLPQSAPGFNSIMEANLLRLANIADKSNDITDPIAAAVVAANVGGVLAPVPPVPSLNIHDLLPDQRAFNNLQALAKLGLGDTDFGIQAQIPSAPHAHPNLSSGEEFSGINFSSSGGLPGRTKATSMQIRCKFGALGTSKGQFNSPHGFCLGVDEEIIVADTNNHRIEVFEKNGQFKFLFGVPGKEEGQLWYPRKVAVMPTNSKFVVCDRGNERSRMQIFSKNGHFMRKIAIRYIDIVAGLAVTSKGQIVAVDSVSPTVFIISEDGDLIHWFDCSDYMREPSDIAIRDNDFYVCDFKGHCVAVFKDDGTFQYRIGNEKVTCFPNGIDISNAGDILIGDSHGNRFHVACFSREGVLQTEFECPHVKVSRCCGLKITSEGYIVTLAKNNHHVLVLNTLYVH
ncbi:TRIM56 family protein [Megaselia abdita]